MMNVTFVGGAMDGRQQFVADDIKTLEVENPDTGERAQYRRHLVATSKGPESSTAIFVLSTLSPEDAHKAVRAAFPSRNSHPA
jgi:hypothetical protein